MRALAAVLLAIGCASPRPLAPPTETPGKSRRAEAETRAELALGKRVDRQLAARFGFYGERRLCAYVQAVGERVASGAERRDIRYRFTVIDDPAVNAFAVPGGFVYVTRGLLAHLGSEAELAAVLAHEVAHVDRRHTLRQQAWQEDRSLAWTGADSVRFYARRRDNEREADALAVRQLARLGYDPRAMRSLLERLGRVERELGECASDADDAEEESHPATAARIARVAHAIGPRRAAAGSLGIERYLGAIDGISYGENPRHGFVAGQAWVLPDASLAFDAPEGWKSSGSARVFWAQRPDESAVLIVIRISPEALERDGLSGAEHTQVAGRHALWAPVEVDQSWYGRVAVIDLDFEQLLLIASARRKSEGVAEIDRLLSGFRVLGRLREQRPARLRVIRSEGRATLAALARSGRIPLAELARLNGVSVKASLAPGKPVKLVAR